jgi:hypothetical protein
MHDSRTSYNAGLQRESLGIDVRHPDYNFEGSNLKFREAVDRTFWELQELLLTKHADYGPKNISESPGGPLNGLRVRMHDKLARLNNLVDSGADPQHESLEDTFKDMANYAIIGLLVLRGQWDNK